MPFGGLAPQLTSARSGEVAPATFDFTSQMGAIETVSTQVVAAAVYSGTDANPTAIISGAATASGKIVSQNVAPVIVGNIYSLLCTITTSGGKTLKQAAFLAVTATLT